MTEYTIDKKKEKWRGECTIDEGRNKEARRRRLDIETLYNRKRLPWLKHTEATQVPHCNLL